MRRALIHLFCLPWNLVAWLAVGIVWILWGRRLKLGYGVLSVEMRHDSWPVRTWYRGWSATTLGHAIIFAPNPRVHTITHEHVHVKQFEAAMIASWAVGTGTWLLSGMPWLGIGIWTLGAVVAYGAAVVGAFLRGEPIYRGNHLEEAAYSIAKPPVADEPTRR